MRILLYLTKVFLNTAFPAACDFCQKKLWVGDDLSICRTCKASVLPEPTTALCSKCAHPLENDVCLSCAISPSELNYHMTVFFYSGLGRNLIQSYKFNKRKSYVNTLVDLIIQTKENFLKEFDVIVPVTITKSDYFERDFCPVLTVCKKVAKKFNLKIIMPIAKLPKQKAQHKKTREERKNEMSKQYKIIPSKMKALQDKRVLIVDDVLTTGSTLSFFCEKIKKHALARHLQTFTFARTILEND